MVPAFNAAAYLPAALDSVLSEAARNQSSHRLEILVVDDASSDGTADVAAAYAARGVGYLRRDKQGGAGTARNNGIAASRGDYLAFLDADDLWPAGRLGLLMTALLAEPGPRIAFGHMRQFLSPDMSVALRQRLRCPTDPMPGYCAGGMLLRRGDFERIGVFEEDIKVGEFIGWYARARDRGFTAALIGDVVLERRIHGSNQTIRHRANYADYVHVLKRALDRRRTDSVS